MELFEVGVCSRIWRVSSSDIKFALSDESRESFILDNVFFHRARANPPTCPQTMVSSRQNVKIPFVEQLTSPHCRPIRPTWL